MTKILSANNENIAKAVQIINDGGVAILPSDTVYGFFSNAENPESIERVFNIKARDKRKPFVIYSNKKKVEEVGDINSNAKTLINNFWPSALAVIVNKKDLVSDNFTRGKNTVAIMTAGNKVMSEIINGVSSAVFGTTCNLSGEPELKTAEEVKRFENDVDIIITDDSLLVYNKPSTIVDCTKTPPEILRLSAIAAEDIQKVLPSIKL